MNKRQKKKLAKRPMVKKSIVRLVNKYTKLHDSYDRFGGIFQYRVVGKTEVGDITFDDMELYTPITKKTLDKIKAVCEILYLATNTDTLSGERPEPYDSSYRGNQYNYRLTNESSGEYMNYMGCYVWQETVLEDFYRGTIYIPLHKGRFLAYDYDC